MKKVSVRFAILCMLALLVDVTALAASGIVSNLQQRDANVTVETVQSESGDPMFHITRTNAENGKLYTVLIRSGGEQDEPSGGDNGNIVYMDMVEAQNGVVEVSKAYPKMMAPGTYRVYVSDYKQSAITQAATFDVGDAPHPDDATKPGDLNNDGQRTIDDITNLIKLVANRATLEEAGAVADLNGDKTITVDDITALIKIVANRE